MESSDYMTDAIDIDVDSFSGTKDILVTCDDKSWISERKNTATSTDTTIPRFHAHIFKMPKSTLDYYRNLSHSTYLLSGMSTNKRGGAYLHMAVSPVDGTIYATDIEGNQAVQISDLGRHISCFKTKCQPRGIILDSVGNIVVTCDSCNIQFYNQSGSTCDELGNFGSSNGFFDWPYGVVYGHKNELYVADAKNMRVQVRQPGKGWTVHSVYKQKPIGLAVCPDGTLLVSTRSQNPELWKIDEEGSKTKINIADDGIARDNDFGFSQIAIDKDGFILLVDRGSHSILVVDMKGQLHCRIGQKGSLPGQFDNPSGIVLTRDGRIVVSEHGNRRIQIF